MPLLFVRFKVDFILIIVRVREEGICVNKRTCTVTVYKLLNCPLGGQFLTKCRLT